ncbi:MAG: precorrin-6A/cobalt-precorrin-6A reductase [Gammaproteobacteria bacterium]|nr:precorrin-6A/cobalt-precorrin-6A reductase [Gammaproteobacteria bacterium]
MKILLLGGTADGRKLADILHRHQEYQQQISVIYSVAGLVRIPKLDCAVISGGFTQFGGLKNYINQQQIDAVLDVTHPYASKMSHQAALAASDCAIPYWRFHRPAWQQSAGDNWQTFDYLEQLPALLGPYQRVFFTIGQLNSELITALDVQQTAKSPCHVVRTAALSKAQLSDSMLWLKGIGPFSVEDEIALMQQHGIEVLVTKNSGGRSTCAKLEAARKLKIPVFIQTRPLLPNADQLFVEPCAVVQHILKINNHE